MSLLLALTGSDGGALAPAVAGGLYDSKQKKRKFVAEVDGKLKIFSSANAAVNAIKEKKPELDEPEKVVQEIEEPIAPVYAESVDFVPIEIPLIDIERTAKAVGQYQQFNEYLNRLQYQIILDKFQKWKAEQDDEDDVEALLMMI